MPPPEDDDDGGDDDDDGDDDNDDDDDVDDDGDDDDVDDADDDDDDGGCWSRGEVPPQCWSDQGLGRPHLAKQPPRTLHVVQPPTTTKHHKH